MKKQNALRSIRLKRKLTQTQLAQKLNLTKSCICIMERNGIKMINTAKSYAAALDCDWRELID